MILLPYDNLHDISIGLVFYDGQQNTMRRTFYLRNLTGHSEEEQIQHAREILDCVAEEIYLITKASIDKGVIKLNNKKVDEIIYGYEPARKMFNYRYGIKLSIQFPISQIWIKETPPRKMVRWQIPISEQNNGWHKEIHNGRRAKTITLPVGATARSTSEVSIDKEVPFLVNYGHRKRGRRKTGWKVYYDSKEPTLIRFLKRFSEEGNLCLGKNRYFGTIPDFGGITGAFLSLPKQKTSKVPKKSKLASQPTDETEYVYVIRLGRNNIFKIGKSNDPQGRLASLQTASPYKLKLAHVFKADNASAAEEELHIAFTDSRMEGEWFRLTTNKSGAITSITEYKNERYVINGQEVNIKELFQK